MRGLFLLDSSKACAHAQENVRSATKRRSDSGRSSALLGGRCVGWLTYIAALSNCAQLHQEQNLLAGGKKNKPLEDKNSWQSEEGSLRVSSVAHLPPHQLQALRHGPTNLLCACVRGEPTKGICGPVNLKWNLWNSSGPVLLLYTCMGLVAQAM
jgi:hypothetical protein